MMFEVIMIMLLVLVGKKGFVDVKRVGLLIKANKLQHST